MALEKVHAVWDYYDGVLTGVAEYRGAPHYFEREWSEAERDYLPTFRLKLLPAGLLEQALEQWQIFRQWEAAFHRGEVTAEQHPAEPGANARYSELEQRLRNAVAELAFLPQRLEPRFVAASGQEHRPKGVVAECLVEWQDAA